MTNYEIRDLNDEINSLLKEKRHWESQIVALGGANYKRANMAMVDDGGREVPGTRGYKYFGRARELPGVKEMFEKGGEYHKHRAERDAAHSQKPGGLSEPDEDNELTGSKGTDRGVGAQRILPDV